MTATRSRTPWSARALRLGLALLVAGTVFAPFAVAQQSPGAPPLCGRNSGGWESIDVPFTEGSQAITSWSISSTSTLMFATNGTVVMRSMNRGCSWNEAWRLDDIPAPGSTASSNESVIEQVHVSQSPLAAGEVFVTVDQLRPVSRPRVFSSSDAGETFQPSERGLEGAIGRPEQIATAPSNPARVYLLTDTSGIQRSLLPDGLPPELEGAKGVAQVLYESIDGGNNWSPMTPAYPGDPWNGIEVDPLDADRVWLFGDKGFQRAGEMPPVPADPARPAAISDMDVFHLSGQQARVVATAANEAEAYRSPDGGRSFVAAPIQGVARSVVAMSPIQEALATSTGVWVEVSGRRPLSLTPADRRPILDLYLTDGAGSELWGRSETTIERKVFAGHAHGKFDVCEDAADDGIVLPGCPHAETDFEVPCVETEDVGEPALKPPSADVTLMPGESKTVRFDFDLPTSGEEMDVFFLIDISGSMQDAIDGTARAMHQIVTHLTNKGHDVHFGIGEYRSYDHPPAYRRVVEITNDCGAVEEALESLIASSGGEETQLEALYQVAMGESRPGVSAVVPAGQEAGFRPEAETRIIIHTTDEKFSEGPPHPSYEEVATALNSVDAKQVGIAIESGFETAGATPLEEKPLPSEGLTRVARDTGAVAPEGGVDCNGDGYLEEGPTEEDENAPPREPHEGEPVVCKISPLRVRNASHMAPAIIEMLESQITPPKVCWDVPLDVAVIDDADTGCVPPKLLGDPDAMSFELTLTCPQLQTRKRFSFQVGAEVDGVRDDRSTVSVLCKVPVKPERKTPPVTPFLPLPLVPFLPPPPAPPEIPPVPNPNPNPQPNPQSQAQAQAQAAMAHQEQHQPQLAYVYAQHQQAAAAAQETAGGKEAEYAMSSYSEDSRGVPPEAIFMIGAMTMSAAFGCVTLAREKVRVQHVRR